MKTALIIGGNSGMGKATAVALADKGYRVIIHGRDPVKTREVAEMVGKKSDNHYVEYIIADLSLLKGIREFVKEVKQRTEAIHTLVLCSGVLFTERVVTEDGMEKSFVVQYLCRFAVTYLLMDELKRGQASIVQVGASVLPNSKIFFQDITLAKSFSMYKSMGQEMYANHLMVQEVARNYSDDMLRINMMNVGIAKTEITRNMNFFIRFIVNLIGSSPDKAARNAVYLASDESVNFSGYFLKKPGNCAVKEKVQYDPLVAEKLWQKSLELIRSIC